MRRWQVCGRVVDAEGRPVPGARVQVLDDDPVWDALVGRTRTDEDGYFEVVYDQQDFAKLLDLERTPDLYVIVKDWEGNRLYRTSPSKPSKSRYAPGAIEYFHIVLD
jgi:hypothetical protein